MFNKLLGILAAIGGFFSALFYVLFQQKKEENKRLQESYNRMKDDVDEQRKKIDAERKATEQLNMEKTKHEEIKQDINNNHLSNFNAGIEFLQN